MVDFGQEKSEVYISTLSFMARMIISFLKMVMKSRNKSTQCLKMNKVCLEIKHDTSEKNYLHQVIMSYMLH